MYEIKQLIESFLSPKKLIDPIPSFIAKYQFVRFHTVLL